MWRNETLPDMSPAALLRGPDVLNRTWSEVVAPRAEHSRRIDLISIPTIA